MENQLYDYSPIADRPPTPMPEGKRLALYVGLNLEHFPIDGGGAAVSAVTSKLTPDPLNYGWRDYGLRVGLWRILDLLGELGVTPTAIVNSDVLERYPQVVAAGTEQRWDWVAHGVTNARLHTGMERSEEGAVLDGILSRFDKHVGARPRGWLGPAMTETFETPSLLAERGFDYLLDWCADDRPFPLRVPGMISVPYSVDLNDLGIFGQRTVEGAAYERMLLDQFEVMHHEGGGVLAIPVHPFVTGVPFRFKYLERALRAMTAPDDVWLTTATGVADAYLGAQSAVA